VPPAQCNPNGSIFLVLLLRIVRLQETQQDTQGDGVYGALEFIYLLGLVVVSPLSCGDDVIRLKE